MADVEWESERVNCGPKPKCANIRVSHSGLPAPEVRISLILWHDRYHISIEEAKDLRDKLDEIMKEIEGV